jgi:hypothetical protein
LAKTNTFAKDDRLSIRLMRKEGSKLRYNTGKIGSLPDVAVAVPTLPIYYKKPKRPPEPSSELLRELQALNHILTTSAADLEGQCQVMRERIEMLESTVGKNKEFVTGLRGRLASLTMTLAEEDTPTAPAVTEITPDTVIDYLQRRPLVLDPFIQGNQDVSFSDLCLSLDEDTQLLFIDYSLKQLERISRCYRVVGSLSANVEDKDFLDRLATCAKEVFTSDICYIFVKDVKAGHLGTRFDEGDGQIVLKEGNSVVSQAIESQRVMIYTDPENSPSYSPSLDPLFNPENRPVIVIPLARDALLFVVHTDPLTFCYTNEDVAVGSFFAMLARPLLRYTMQLAVMQRNVKERLDFTEFVRIFCEKNCFLDAIPCLADGLEKLVGAQQTQLFMSDGGEFFTYTVQNDQLVQKRYTPGGSIAQVWNSGHFLVVSRLNETSVPAFDEAIDSPRREMSFGGFPITREDGTRVAVLCIAQKRDGLSFNDRDIDCALTLSPLIALAIQRCLDTEKRSLAVQSMKDLREFPASLVHVDAQTYSDENVEVDQIVVDIAAQAKQTVKSEFIAIYDADFKCLVSLNYAGEKVGPLVSASFVEHVFASPSLNILDVSHYPNYSGVAASSLVAVINQKVGIIAINSTTKLGHFERLHEVILSAYCSLVVLSLEVHELKQSIAAGKLANESLDAVVRYCDAAMQAKEPFTAMMASICERSGMQQYCILRYIKLSQSYEILLTNQSEPGATIPETDQVIQKMKEIDQIFTSASSDFADSAVPHRLGDPEHLAVVPVTKTELVLVLGGSEASQETIFLQSLAPILSILVESHLIRFKPASLLVNDMNKMNFSNSPVNADHIASVDFPIASLTVSQRIEAVLHIFVRSRFLDVLHTDLAHLAELIKMVEKGYTAVPYHNWEHAVTVTQFLYTIIGKSELAGIFSEIEIVALFLAALCHDVDHKGINSWTLVKCNEA